MVVGIDVVVHRGRHTRQETSVVSEVRVFSTLILAISCRGVRTSDTHDVQNLNLWCEIDDFVTIKIDLMGNQGAGTGGMGMPQTRQNGAMPMAMGMSMGGEWRTGRDRLRF